ncbi:uncharacterized protein LOC120891895 isoform X2 [Ictidomys tridecemlineatus]
MEGYREKLESGSSADTYFVGTSIFPDSRMAHGPTRQSWRKRRQEAWKVERLPGETLLQCSTLSYRLPQTPPLYQESPVLCLLLLSGKSHFLYWEVFLHLPR